MAMDAGQTHMRPVDTLASSAIGTQAEPPPEAVDQTPGDLQLINQFREQVKVPGWLSAAYKRAAEDRHYLHTEVFAEDDPERASCNDLLRSIYAKLALIWPENPEPNVKPPELVEPEWPDDQMIDDQTGAPVEQLKEVWAKISRKRERLARTSALVLKKFAKQSRMGPVFQRAALEAMTTSLAWVKVGWMEDPTKDCLGRRQTRPDGLDQAAKLRQLLTEYQDGLWSDDDARFREMKDLEEYVRRSASSWRGSPAISAG